jgi:L-ascorbate metabolism protein UlaG (beta-lactamase superfamily)
MKDLEIEYVGHACLLISARSETFITDPWFTNPVMANSWYHLPRLARTITELPKLDYIYVSHEHADHLDIPALRQLTPTATIIIPRYGDGKLERTLADANLPHKILALADGETYTTPNGNSVAIYLADTGSKDSSLVISDGQTCIYNHTDNWITSAKMELIGKQWKPDIAFQCYAGVGSFPSYMLWPLDYRIELGSKKKLQLFQRMKEAASALQPAAIVPFGASFGYLRPETLWLNKICETTPQECADWLQAQGLTIPVVFFDHGDLWTKSKGVHAGRVKHSLVISDAEVAEYSRHYVDVIQHKREEELVPADDLDTLDARFGEYLQAWVRAEGSKFAETPLTIAFAISGARGIHWSVDFGAEKNQVSKAIHAQPNLYLTMTETELFNALTHRFYTLADLYCASRIQMNRYPYDVYHKGFFDSFFWWDETEQIQTNRKLARVSN